MTTVAASALFTERLAQLKQKQLQNIEEATASIPIKTYKPKNITSFVIKPISASWEDLQKKLEPVVNLPRFMETRVKELYDQGYGAELETAAEIAQATAKKGPCYLFAAMISKKSGNWETRTLKMVQATWEARKRAMQVMDKLKLKAESFKPVLALAWRLKGNIMHFLGLATEQGVGIKNPVGLFFWLAKKPTIA